MSMDAIQFFKAWTMDPFRVASVTPSGDALANLMVSEIGIETGAVIELGPGTGAFTRALLRRGVPEERLILVESGVAFAALLAARHPRATVLARDAATVRGIDLSGAGPVGAVISGLPLLSMPTAKVMAILTGAFRHLSDGGAFYQFTYGPRCPVPGTILGRLDLRARRIGHTYRNLPPAAVYRLSRRTAPAPSLAAHPGRPPSQIHVGSG